MITPNQKKRLFVDMDGTLAEWRILNLELTTEEESDPEIVAKRLHEILTEDGYYRTLRPVTSVIEAINFMINDPVINKLIDVYVASCYIADTDHSSPLLEKNEWIDENIPGLPKSHRIFIPNGEDKTKYIPGGVKKTDFLLDDYSKNLHDWERAGGTGIKFLNGINATKGTWKGARVNHDVLGKILAKDVTMIIFPEEMKVKTIITERERQKEGMSDERDR